MSLKVWFVVPNQGDIVEGRPKNGTVPLPIFGPFYSEEAALSRFDYFMNTFCTNQTVRNLWKQVSRCA